MVVPEAVRIFWRTGLDIRRTEQRDDESQPWGRIGLATPLRMGLDLLLDRPLPDAVADLDAVLRAGLVDRAELHRMLSARRDRGIVRARRAEELADPRAESPPESRMRVWLVLDGLRPQPQYWIEDCRVGLSALTSPSLSSRWRSSMMGRGAMGNCGRSITTAIGSTGYRPPAGKSCSSPLRY